MEDLGKWQQLRAAGEGAGSCPPLQAPLNTHRGGGQGRVIGGWWCSVTLEHPQSKPLALKEPWGPQKLLPTAGLQQEGGAPDLRCAPGYASPKPCPGTPWPTSPFEAPGPIPPETPQKRLLWAPPGRRKNLFTSFSPPFHSFHPSLTCGRCRREKSARHRVPTAPLHYGVLGSRPGQGAAAPNSLLCFL